ncbi:hypothetical protein EYF80_026561 [Liparis tanakae]|uniref:Uncharacterized protein n=1 Tax=Liparis tanakae TaxID=230148 RepID=A0A4Z2HBG8_9TELE|nr:hypothetical protein EYF80_026561 [Liparis tanakae]
MLTWPTVKMSLTPLPSRLESGGSSCADIIAKSWGMKPLSSFSPSPPPPNHFLTSINTIKRQ